MIGVKLIMKSHTSEYIWELFKNCFDANVLLENSVTKKAYDSLKKKWINSKNTDVRNIRALIQDLKNKLDFNLTIDKDYFMKYSIGICSDGEGVFSAKFKVIQPKLDVERVKAIWIRCINHRLELETREFKNSAVMINVLKIFKKFWPFFHASSERVRALESIAESFGLVFRSMNIEYDEKW